MNKLFGNWLQIIIEKHDFSSVGIIVVIVCTSVGGIGLIYALLYLCKALEKLFAGRLTVELEAYCGAKGGGEDGAEDGATVGAAGKDDR
ncbi:hypothetical protein C0Q70_00922 [Pomacea canaliculata]|uniref:Uncharacterized protein n=1 Tax=Pomacea canaliculata TaxID=400727 RepID=A0A2T7PY34_POMCA|nr:hypothetical protein C0Q70_00922 [Pomacea canaliculata]